MRKQKAKSKHRSLYLFFGSSTILPLVLPITLMATEFMGVDELKPGMKGYGLSTFKGTKVDTFNVEIIEVMHNDMPKGDVILARISGGIVDTAGIIAGMSGSPIYVNNKLIGALAYGYTAFPNREHLTGITPIKEMLNPPSAGFSSCSDKLSFIKLPIYCPGIDDQTLQEFRKMFPSFNVFRAQEIGGTIEDSLIPYPGSSLGVLLVDGDVRWGAIGTCTFKDGNKIWGFGHSMMTLGKTSLPMTGGYIYSVVSSSYDSYKLGVPTKVIGSINNDNARGIIGVIGEMSEMADFNLLILKSRTLRGGNPAPMGKDEEFHYRVVREKNLLPFMFGGLVFYSIYTGAKGIGDMTAEVSLEIKGSNEESQPQEVRPQPRQDREFKFKNLYTGNTQSITNSIVEIFGLIQNNPFQKIDITEITLKLTPSDTIKLAKIDDLQVDKTEISPGDSLKLFLSLLTYRGSKIKHMVEINVPPWTKRGELWVKVENGRAVREKSKSQLTTLEAFANWLSKSPKDNELVITLTQKGAVSKGKSVRSEEFQSLPPSVACFIKSEADGETKLIEKTISTEYVITETKSTKLEVK